MITQNRLKEVLNYDEHTGIFTWKVSTANRVKVGDKAGSINVRGYRQLKLDKRVYLAHRLIWMYIFGKFPNNGIDHINRIKDDNRLCNLRDVTQQENCKNQSIRSNNSSGLIGVCWNKDKNKWHARICIEGKNKFLGYFTDIKDAMSARQLANKQYKYHANHGLSIN